VESASGRVRRPVIVLGALALLWTGTGTAGLLGTGAPAAERAVADLAAEDDLNLYAVFVSSFDDTDPGEWAEDTAQLSGLDATDVLLAVAVGGAAYEYGYWVSEDFPRSEVDLERAVTGEVDPRLAAGDGLGHGCRLVSASRGPGHTGAAQSITGRRQASRPRCPT
jgi:phage tail sheath gpL-like